MSCSREEEKRDKKGRDEEGGGDGIAVISLADIAMTSTALGHTQTIGRLAASASHLASPNREVRQY